MHSTMSALAHLVRQCRRQTLGLLHQLRGYLGGQLNTAGMRKVALGGLVRGRHLQMAWLRGTSANSQQVGATTIHRHVPAL